MNSGDAHSARFSLADLELFSAASHDRNPLHLSPDYARRTPYGQQVVFGILGLLAALGKTEAPLSSALSKVQITFEWPMFMDLDYSVSFAAQDAGANAFTVKLTDGSSTLMKASLEFAPTPQNAPQPSWPTTRNTCRVTPADPSENEITKGAVAHGEYSADPTAFENLLRRFAIDERAFGRLQLSALLWTSYLVGMEQPGLRALFSKLNLSFENPHRPPAAKFTYQAKVESLNALGLLTSELRLYASSSGSSTDKASGPTAAPPFATGTLRAFVLPKNYVGSVSQVAAHLSASAQPHALKGKVALVIGASRGLGAMLATALALQECTVIASYHRAESEANRLVASLAQAPGKVILAKGDAADLAWCKQLERQISTQFGRLDFLICNACPSLLPLRLESDMVTRVNEYIARAVAMVSVPTSVFSTLLGAQEGWSVTISSVAVENPLKEWPHYVAAKSAVEALVRVAALQYPKVNFLIVRPSRLRTDLTNGPGNLAFEKDHSILPEVAASKIVSRLAAPANQRVEVLVP